MIFLHDPQHLKLEQGRTDTISVDIKDFYGDPYQFGSSPIAVLGIKRNADSEEPLLTIATLPNTADGVATFDILPQLTANLQPGTYFYDVALCENGTEFRTVIREGILDILAVGSKISHASNPTYWDWGFVPGIVICTETEYTDNTIHPEFYAIVTDDFETGESTWMRSLAGQISGSLQNNTDISMQDTETCYIKAGTAEASLFSPGSFYYKAPVVICTEEAYTLIGWINDYYAAIIVRDAQWDQMAERISNAISGLGSANVFGLAEYVRSIDPYN